MRGRSRAAGHEPSWRHVADGPFTQAGTGIPPSAAKNSAHSPRGQRRSGHHPWMWAPSAMSSRSAWPTRASEIVGESEQQPHRPLFVTTAEISFDCPREVAERRGAVCRSRFLQAVPAPRQQAPADRHETDQADRSSPRAGHAQRRGGGARPRRGRASPRPVLVGVAGRDRNAHRPGPRVATCRLRQPTQGGAHRPAARQRPKLRPPPKLPITSALLRLHPDCMHGEYGDVDSDYVFVKPMVGSAGRADGLREGAGGPPCSPSRSSGQR